MRILSLCDHSGIMVRPWFLAGHDVLTVDIEQVKHGMPSVQCDILNFMPEIEYDIVFAFPPCTHLAASGARWWVKKGDDKLMEALKLVQRCIYIAKEAQAKWYLLENPVGRLSSHWRKPDYKYHPFEYAGYEGGENDKYSKQTCLWTNKGSTFKMPPTKPCDKSEVDWQMIRDRGWCANKERMRFRSQTPAGFAHAVWQYNDEVLNA